MGHKQHQPNYFNFNPYVENLDCIFGSKGRMLQKTNIEQHRCFKDLTTLSAQL